MRFLLIGAYLLGFRRILILVLMLMGIAIAQRQCSSSGAKGASPAAGVRASAKVHTHVARHTRRIPSPSRRGWSRSTEAHGVRYGQPRPCARAR